jgi:Holliday junction resolvase
MALCTSPSLGGRQPSIADCDWLVAGVALLLEAAADADAIRGGLAVPHVKVEPNGRVETWRDELEALVRRYGRDAHADEFRAAADAYDDLFRRGDAGNAADKGHEELSPKWDDRFQRAYHAEFGIAFDRIIDAFAELIDLAAEYGRVVITSYGAIVERLRRRRRFSLEEVNAFVSAFGIEPRSRWNETPAGFTKRDWEPWRFRRRLSVSARPLIVFGRSEEAKCIYGLAQLSASLSYFPEGIRSGWFPTEYFQSAEMRHYRGTIADELGSDFEREIAQLCAGAGWATRRSVQMSTLGAPSRLGDIDVVAWRPDCETLWLIECKRLQPTRTISEIVDRLRQFKGESNDLLAKHMRRLDWMRAHLDIARRTLGIAEGISEVHAILVTNNRMPMQYAEGLPLPPEHITSAGNLLSLLESPSV